MMITLWLGHCEMKRPLGNPKEGSIPRAVAGIFCVFWFFSAPAQALLPYKPSAQELKALPAYCQGRKAPMATHYLFQHCAGIKQLNRGRLPLISSEERRYYLGDAVNRFKEAIAKTKERNSMRKYDMYLGMTYRYQADAYRRKKEIVNAIKAYNQAIKYYPKGVRAYIDLSRLLAKRGSTADARKVLQDGLEVLPDSKALQKMLEKF